MINSNKLLQGLALGIVGCTLVPIINSRSSTGGGVTLEAVSNTQQLNQQTSNKQELPKSTNTFNLVLAGTNINDGVVAILSSQPKEGGNKKKWHVDRVTWRNSKWKNNWILYYDSNKKEYTFTDKNWTHRKPPCYGSGRGWNNAVACFAYGKVTSHYTNVWNGFPKIKLEGWQTRWTQSRGYSLIAMPNSLERCNQVTITERENDNLQVTINCKNITLYKTFPNPENKKR